MTKRKTAFNTTLTEPYGTGFATKTITEGHYMGDLLPPEYLGEVALVRKDPQDPTCYLVQFHNLLLRKAFGWSKVPREHMVLHEDFTKGPTSLMTEHRIVCTPCGTQYSKEEYYALTHGCRICYLQTPTRLSVPRPPNIQNLPWRTK